MCINGAERYACPSPPPPPPRSRSVAAAVAGASRRAAGAAVGIASATVGIAGAAATVSLLPGAIGSAELSVGHNAQQCVRLRVCSNWNFGRAGVDGGAQHSVGEQP